MLFWTRTIRAKFLVIFLAMALVLVGAKFFYYHILMSVEHEAQDTMAQELEEMVLADGIESIMPNLQAWEHHIRTPEKITALMHGAHRHLEDLRSRQKVIGNMEGVYLVDTAIADLQAFGEAFHDIIQAMKQKGFDPDSGLYGATREAAHDLEGVLNALDTGTLVDAFFRMRISEMAFVLNGDINVLGRFQKDYLLFQQHLSDAPFSDYLDLQKAVAVQDALRQAVQAYHAAVEALSQSKKTPPKTQSHQKIARQANTLETQLTAHYLPHAIRNYLMVRRHEKDYLSRLDDAYLAKLGEVLGRMRANTMASGISVEDKTVVLERINRYEQEFQALVRHTRFVGKQKRGMQTKTQEVIRLMVEISAQTRERLAMQFGVIWEDLVLRIRWGLIFSATVLLLGILLVGILVSRNVSRPLMRLKNAAMAVGREKGAEGSAEIFNIRSQDEIGQLATAFRTMVEDLSGHALALTEAKVYTDNILLSMTDTLLLVDGAGCILRVNRLDLLGYTEQELLGSRMEDLFVENRPDASEPEVQPWGPMSEAFSQESLLLRKDGRLVPVLVSGSKMQGRASGESIRIFVVRDISDIVAFRQDLERARQVAEASRDHADAASRTKSLFVANMSHEIRTPMNAILGLTHLCLQTDITQQQQDYLDKIHGSANALLRIINDILDFSKIEADKLTVENIVFHLGDVLNDLSTLITIKTQGKDLEIVFITARGVPRTLIGDPTRLGQVLTNVTNNAAKFTDSGEIILTIEQREAAEGHVVLQFSVRDTGIGMTPEQQEHLFQAFSQADGGTTRKYGGTGLGLTISRRLVDLMGGTIWVESTQGEGSTFFFTVRCGLPKEATKQALQLPDDLLQKRVLVVDDNQTSQDMLRAALESFSLQVSVASTGMAGLLELEKKHQEGVPYDLLLLDWRMPRLDGVQTFHCLKSLETPLDLPTLFMLPQTEQASVRYNMGEVQPEAYLDKPIHISIMFDAVMTAFGKENIHAARQDRGTTLNPVDTVGGARVLLVEDNEINQQVSKELLEMSGVVVEVVENGQEAVQRVAETEFELVLMDIQMPVMDGYQATREIRKTPLGADLPIVAMTANVMVQDLARCWEAGMDAHIGKPIDPNKLFRVLSQWIKPRERRVVRRTPSENGKRQPRQAGALIPAVSGINTEFGLSRVGGNMTLFRSLLRKFAQNHADQVADLQKAIDEGEIHNARRMLHTLKGVSGTLGALKLQALARSVEANLVLTTAFVEELALVMASIETLLGPEEKDEEEPICAPVDVATLLQTLIRLQPHVERRRPKNCRSILEELAQMSFPSDMIQDREKLAKWIGKYKMKEARVLLEDMIKRLTHGEEREGREG